MIALVAAALIAFQQDTPVVTVELTAREVRVGETVTLRISVQARGGRVEIDYPTLAPDLVIVGTQDFSETSLGMGGRSTTTRRDLILLPQASGTFSIPAIRVNVGGRQKRTEPLQLRVLGAAAAGETDPGRSAARVVVRMEPDTVYVGQQSTLVGEVLLSTDLQMRLTRPPSYDAPSPADFWIQELQSDPATDVRIVAGQRYIVQRFYRAYFPLLPGRFAFAPARVTYEAREGFLFAPQTRELRSASPQLTVLPVPQDGRPQGFGGAVGSISMSAHLEPGQTAVGDAVSLVVELRGSGNIKALPPPELPDMPGFDVLDPSESTQIDSRPRQLTGSKRFTWVLVPEREGTFDLPAIEYSSFDPEARTFRSHRADPGTVSVMPAGEVTRPRVSGLRPEPEIEPLGWVRSPVFLGAQVVPFALLALGLFVQRRRSSPSPRIKRGWDQRLLALRAARGNPFAHAEKLLRDVLAQVVPTARVRSGLPAELHADLQRLVSLDFADRVAGLLERLEIARYAPSETSHDQRKQVLDELEVVLNAAWKHVRTGAHARHAIVLPIVLALQAGGNGGLFEEGMSAYRDGRYNVSVQHFERYVQQRPADASGWYNLAVAYEAERRPARAAWAHLHALQLQPRARDVEAHLQRLGSARLADRVRPLLRLTTAETLLLASALWWLGAALLAWAIAHRKRKPGWAAALPISLAGVLLILWSIERALPAPAVVLDQGAPLFAGMNLHADVVRHLQPLSSVNVIEERDGWARVRTPEGETGWVSRDGLGRL